MGMPNIMIDFKTRGITAIQRSQRGIVALVLNEAKPADFKEKYTVYSVDDIEKTLSEANKTQIKLALIGYQNAPAKVLVFVRDAAATDYTDILKKLETVRFDYLVIPEIKAADTQTIASWVKSMRTTAAKDKRVKAVLPNTAADFEGVINVTNKTFKTADAEYTTAQYCSRIAGLIAGTPMRISCTFAPLPEVVSVDVKEDNDKAVDAGEFFVYFDGEKIKVARGVNSFVTTMAGKGQQYSKIKIVDLIDMIHDDIKKTAQDSYIGKYENSYDNRCLLITAILGYLHTLEAAKLLGKNKSTVDIDVTASKNWLESNGKYSKDELAAMTDAQIKQLEDYEDQVFLKASIRCLDAIENIELAVEI